MGGKSEIKEHLDNKHSARYFADEFILPFGRKAILQMPAMDDIFIPKLKQEIKRLQEMYFKNKKKNLKPLQKTMKCSSMKCKTGGNLQSSNTDKYAQCVICEGFEHFHCASLKDDKKNDIMEGTKQFICTNCFAENPKKIALEKSSRKFIYKCSC